MTTMVGAPKRIRIDAPDARTAFMLERRLAHLHPAAIGYGLDWRVELPEAGGHLDEIEAEVRPWLGDCGIRSTQIHLGDAVRTIALTSADTEQEHEEAPW